MTKIIAEIGINANGEIGIAKAMMDMAQRCGADMVKFQKRTIEAVYSKKDLDVPRDSPWGMTNREQKHGIEFGYDDYCEIDNYSKLIGLPWFASAWDVDSLTFLDYFDLPCHKIASTMITNCDFLKEVAQRKKLTYISTGLIEDLEPVDKAASIFKYHDCPFELMHCVGEYPCIPENTNLGMIETLKQAFPGIKVGFSSHAVSPVVGALSVALGATTVEAHITLDRSMYGSDQSASLEEPGLKKLVDYCKLAEQAKGDGIKRITKMEINAAAKMRYWEV